MKRLLLMAPLCCLVAASGACSQKKAPETRPAVSTTPAPAIPPAAIPNDSPARYLFSAAASSGSKIEFIATRPGSEIKGSFGKFNGAIIAVGSDPSRASVTAEIDMTSLQTDDPALTEALKSPAILNVARYPSARFVSTGVHMGGELGATNTATGTLEWRGITQVVSVPMTLHLRRTGVAVDAEVSISRKDFGVVLRGKRGALVADKVQIRLDIYAEPANPAPAAERVTNP